MPLSGVFPQMMICSIRQTAGAFFFINRFVLALPRLILGMLVFCGTLEGSDISF